MNRQYVTPRKPRQRESKHAVRARAAIWRRQHRAPTTKERREQ